MKRILALSLIAAGLAACDDSPTEPKGKAPSVGEEIQLNVQFNDNCDNAVLRTARVMAVSNRAILVEDTSNPAGGFTAEDYRSFAAQYDDLVWPVDTRAFGEPDDIDGNGRVVFFFTRAINDLTTPGSGLYINGLFFSRDLFPKRDKGSLQGCPSSNVAEMVYMLAPDPERGGPFSYSNAKQNTVGVMAHETQHLISASRRLYKLNAGNDTWNETVWLNEGLSHVAEEMVFYQASGLPPRRNLDGPALSNQAYASAFLSYNYQNSQRYGSYLGDTERNAPYETDDDLATRGAIWNFLRFAADRRNGDDNQLWNSLVNSRTIGMANLRAALGTDPIPLFRDWVVSVYMDDAAPGTDARFTQPSWNWRQLYTNGLPLRTRRLANGVGTTLTLDPGGASYLRFGVGAAAPAELRVSSGAGAGACTAVPALAVGQVYTAAPAADQTLCVQQPGDYTLIAFYGADTEGDPLPLTVTGNNILTIAAQPSASRAAPFAAALAPSGEPAFREDVQTRRKLRERERALNALVRNGAGPRFSQASASSAPDPAKLYLAVGRTR